MSADGLIILPIKVGRTGNNLFQLAFSHYLSKQFENVEIVHFGVPELGISEHPGYEQAMKQRVDFVINQNNYFKMPILDSGLDLPSGIIQSSAWGMNSKYFLESRDYLRKLLPQQIFRYDDSTIHGGEFEILCHVRGGDVWDRSRFKKGKNLHPDYAALPLSYYENILETSNKRVRFLIEDSTPNWYVSLLRERFGNKTISFSSSVEFDFKRMLLAENLALSLSTFSWMAGFLGEAKVVHFPVIGLFDRGQRPDLDFSLEEKLVRKYFFSPHHWTGSKKDLSWILNSNVKGDEIA